MLLSKYNVFETSLEIVKYLVELYPDGVQEKNSKGRLPIHVAALRQSKSPCFSIVNYLAFKYPSGVSVLFNYGEKQRRRGFLLHCLMSNIDEFVIHHQSVDEGTRFVEMVKHLSEVYPQAATVIDSEGKLPIHLACQRDRINPLSDDVRFQCLQILVACAPESLARRDEDGNVPLTIECNSWGWTSGEKLPELNLLRLLTPASLTVLEFMQRGHGALCEFLYKYPDTMDEKTDNTALHMICETDGQVVSWRLDKLSKRLQIQNFTGDLPLYVACRAAPYHFLLEQFIKEYTGGLQSKNNI
mgnify:CR=1 FL=1